MIQKCIGEIQTENYFKDFTDIMKVAAHDHLRHIHQDQVQLKLLSLLRKKKILRALEASLLTICNLPNEL